jgi:diaminopimelate decarboxylase
MDHFNALDGEIRCEDVPLSRIAAAVGTTVYVYSAATMRRHATMSRCYNSRPLTPEVLVVDAADLAEQAAEDD